MPIFYRKAIEAAIHPARADWLTEAHLMDWNGLAAALGRLTPEQRCDANASVLCANPRLRVERQSLNEDFVFLDDSTNRI